MDVTFAMPKLGKLCNSAGKLRGEYGVNMAEKISSRLTDLRAAENLEVMRSLPGRCHELTGDRKGLIAIDLIQPWRLVFRPAHKPRPERKDGSLDWKSVTQVEIVEIVDYH